MTDECRFDGSVAPLPGLAVDLSSITTAIHKPSMPVCITSMEQCTVGSKYGNLCVKHEEKQCHDQSHDQTTFPSSPSPSPPPEPKLTSTATTSAHRTLPRGGRWNAGPVYGGARCLPQASAAPTARDGTEQEHAARPGCEEQQGGGRCRCSIWACVWSAWAWSAPWSQSRGPSPPGPPRPSASTETSTRGRNVCLQNNSEEGRVDE